MTQTSEGSRDGYFTIRCRYDFAVADWRKHHHALGVSIQPIVYKCKLSEQWFIFKKIGLKNFIKLYKFEKGNYATD